MSWSADLLSLFRTHPVQLSWVLEIVALATGDCVGDAGVLVATYPEHGAAGIVDVELGGQSVSIQAWRYSAGTARVRVKSSLAADIAEHCRRGSYCRLRCGARSWATADHETVFLGVISNISMASKSVLTIDLWDVLSALANRVGGAMFLAAGATTTLAGAYTPTDSTLDLTSAAYCEYVSGGSGVVRIDTSPPFYLTYTGVSGNQLTGVSSTGQFGTTFLPAGIGVLAAAVVYLHGHPIDIFKRMLTCTGLGTNGAADIYPNERWGWGIPVDDVATADMDIWRDDVVKPISGNHHWDVLIETPPTSSVISWFAGLLSQAGIWPCVRQGKITCRAAQSLRSAEILKSSGISIGYADIVRLDSVEWWDGTCQQRYKTTNILTATPPALDIIETIIETYAWPVSTTISYDLSDLVFDNEAAVQTEVGDRLRRWTANTAEAITVTLAGLEWARICVGDVISLTTDLLYGHMATTYTGWSGRNTFVAEVTPDVLGGTTRLALKVLPNNASADEWE